MVPWRSGGTPCRITRSVISRRRTPGLEPIIGSCRRAAGASGRTSDARSLREPTTRLAALRACAPIRRASLGLARCWIRDLVLSRRVRVGVGAGGDEHPERRARGRTVRELDPAVVLL